MGDRTWWSCLVPACEIDKFRAASHVEDFDEETELDGGTVEFRIYEANYGNNNFNLAVAGAGVRFQGNHGAGSEYPEMAFVSWGQELFEVCSSDWTPLMVYPGDLLQHFNYLLADEAITKLFVGEETEPEFLKAHAEPYSDKPLSELIEEVRALEHGVPMRVWVPLIDKVARLEGDNTVAEQYLMMRLVKEDMVEAAGFAAVLLAQRRKQVRNNEQQAPPPQAPS
jgi:hypothetical protein